MKLHLLATVLLNVSISGVASAEKMLRTRDVKCPKNQIQCQVSDNPRCRRKTDRSPDCRNVKWQTVCCTRNCKPGGNGVRVCETAPKSNSEGYGFGYVAYDEEEEDAFVTPSEDTLDSEDLSSESEDYAGDEDEEEFDSEDVDAFFNNKDRRDCWRLGANSRERLGCGNRSGNNRNDHRPRPSRNDYRPRPSRNDYRPRPSNSSSNGTCDIFSNRNKCQSRNHCEWVIPNGRRAAYCTHRRWEDALDSEDVSSESEDYVVDEDSEEFDSEDLASEDFADDNEDEEDTEDIDFYYYGSRNPDKGYRRYNNDYDDGYNNGYGYGNGSNKYVNDCERQFRNCKDDKSFGYGGTNCARMKQQCYGRRPYGAEVA